MGDVERTSAAHDRRIEFDVARLGWGEFPLKAITRNRPTILGGQVAVLGHTVDVFDGNASRTIGSTRGSRVRTCR